MWLMVGRLLHLDEIEVLESQAFPFRSLPVATLGCQNQTHEITFAQWAHKNAPQDNFFYVPFG